MGEEGKGYEIRAVCLKPGAGETTRTSDLLITNQLLYQLSYAGLIVNKCTIEFGKMQEIFDKIV